MPYILLIVASLCFSMQASALELQLDERIHNAKASTQSVTTPTTPASIEARATPSVTPQHFQWWWLSLIPAILLLMAAGWWLGHWLEARQAHKPEFEPEAEHTDPEPRPKAEKTKFHKTRTVPTLSNHTAPQIQSLDVYKAYRFFLFGKDAEMMEIFEQVYRFDPFDINPYLMSMRILSETDRPLPDLERLLRTGIFLLQSKQSSLWDEVASSGKSLLPEWDIWTSPQRHTTS